LYALFVPIYYTLCFSFFFSFFFHFFFLMLRPPPISTLFPTRRSSDLPARRAPSRLSSSARPGGRCQSAPPASPPSRRGRGRGRRDRKSTRLNSSHRTISYAVFCLKKKKKRKQIHKINNIPLKPTSTID